MGQKGPFRFGIGRINDGSFASIHCTSSSSRRRYYFFLKCNKINNEDNKTAASTLGPAGSNDKTGLHHHYIVAIPCWRLCWANAALLIFCCFFSFLFVIRTRSFTTLTAGILLLLLLWWKFEPSRTGKYGNRDYYVSLCILVQNIAGRLRELFAQPRLVTRSNACQFQQLYETNLTDNKCWQFPKILG